MPVMARRRLLSSLTRPSLQYFSCHKISDTQTAPDPPADVASFVVAASNPFHGLLSPTIRSILVLRLERSASAVRIAAIVCCKVPAFDPSDRIPLSTAALDPIAAT
jgi:hypothetical protein